MVIDFEVINSFPTQVDDNVTRHLSEEMPKNDWDVCILHYLGLDHIGHLAGPSSPLVPPKLDEMGQIIERILNEMQQKVGNAF